MREMCLLTVGSELIQDGRRLRATIVTSANRNTERPLGKRASHDEATQGSRKQGTSWPNNHTMERPRRCFTGSSWHSDCTVSARQVHAGHSSGDDARRRDDVAYFLWDHDPGSDGVASLLPHHPLRRPARWLPVWQQLMSEAVHWLLYVLVLATTMTGWIFGSERGWSISLFFAVPLPMLPTEGSLLANEIGRWARHHGMGAVAGDRCPRGRRHRAQVCFSATRSYSGCYRRCRWSCGPGT